MDEPEGECYTLKGGLPRLLKCCEADIQRILTHASCSVSNLATRATLLIKLYVLHCFESNVAIPKLTLDLVRHAFKVVGGQELRPERPPDDEPEEGAPKKKRNRVAETARRALSRFYVDHFDVLRPADDVLPSTKLLGDVVGYTARELLTNVEVHIKEHYADFVLAYARTALRVEPELQRVAEQSEDRFLANKIVSDLLNVDGAKPRAPQELQSWIAEQRRVVRPEKTRFKENSIPYDLKCDPQDYLLPMLRMARYRETRESDIRLHHTLPLHTSAVPMHITLDTKTLVQLFFGLKPDPESDRTVFSSLGMEKSSLVKSFADHKDAIWTALFRMDRRIFRNTTKFAFNYTIKTDGVSCCVVHMRRDLANRSERKRKRKEKKPGNEEKYIDDVDMSQYAGRQVVGIDPNKGNLMFCSTEGGETRFRYTQGQRSCDLKTAHRNAIMRNMKDTASVSEQTIAQWEAQLNAHNFKTVSVQAFRECIRAKLLVTAKVAAFYRDRWFRKNRLNAYFDKGTSERKMLDAFEREFGSPDKVVVGFGDWKQHHQMKHKPPTMGKGLRKLLRKKYPVFLVDEYCTSKKCSGCESVDDGDCAPFKKYEELSDEERRLTCARPPRNNVTESGAGTPPARNFRGLLRCQSCGKVWNRDENAARNMARLTRYAIERKARPAYLRRSKSPAYADQSSCGESVS